MKVIAGVVLIMALMAPQAAEAQRRNSWGATNPYSFSPYVGVYKDAYDRAADGSDVGWMVGFKAGYQEGDRTTFHLNLAYAHANDVASRTVLNNTVVDNRWVITTVGGDFALVPGTTSIAIGLDAGVAWRSNTTSTAGGDARSDGWATYETVAPALTLRHHFSQRSSLSLSAQDYILDFFEGPVQHSPALTLGLSFR